MFDLRKTILEALYSDPHSGNGSCEALADHIAAALAHAFEPTLADVDRYRWLRDRDLDTIEKGGVFAGRIPENVVVSGPDLDKAIDAAMAS
jgi:hypothetical protein